MPSNQPKTFPYQDEVLSLSKPFYSALEKLLDPGIKPLARQRAETKVFAFADSSILKKTLTVLDRAIDRAHQLDAARPREQHCAHLAVINKAYLLLNTGSPKKAELNLLKEIQDMEERQENPHGQLYLCLAVVYADTDRIDAAISLMNDLLSDPDLENFQDTNNRTVSDFLEMTMKVKDQKVTEEIGKLLHEQLTAEA